MVIRLWAMPPGIYSSLRLKAEYPAHCDANQIGAHFDRRRAFGDRDGTFAVELVGDLAVQIRVASNHFYRHPGQPRGGQGLPDLLLTGGPAPKCRWSSDR